VSTAPVSVRECPDIASSTDEYARRFQGASGEYLLDVQEKSVMRLAHPWLGKSILDVGDGHGQLCRPLLKASCAVTVLGSQATCLERPRRIGGEGVSCVVGDLLEPPFPNQSFDLVIAIRMLAHIHDTKRFIRGLCRVARYAVIVDYPEVRSINAITPALFAVKKRLEGDTRAYRTYRRERLMTLFAENGFGQAKALAQFFWPMVLHRNIDWPAASRVIEALPRALGVTSRLGSPVILRAMRL